VNCATLQLSIMVTPSNLPQRNKPKLCKVNTVVVIAVLTLGLFAALRTPDDSLKFQDDQLELKKTERLGGKLQFGAITHACNAAVDRLVECKLLPKRTLCRKTHEQVERTYMYRCGILLICFFSLYSLFQRSLFSYPQ
jgi:hypothetical protein